MSGERELDRALLDPAQRVEDSVERQERAEKQEERSSFLFNAVIIGGGLFVHAAAVWFLLAVPKRFNAWGEAAVAENAAFELGQCANFPPYSSFLSATGFASICPEQPMKSTLTLSIAAVSAEINGMWLPAVALLPMAAVAAVVVGYSTKLGIATHHRKDHAKRQQAMRAFEDGVAYAAEIFKKVLRVGYFFITELWLTIAQSTVRSQILGGANGMKDALKLYQQQSDGQWVPYPDFLSYQHVMEHWKDLKNFPAASYYSQVERYVNGKKKEFMSKPFTGAIILSAGALYGWMYVLSGGLIAFNVGLVAGWLAVVGQLCAQKYSQQQQAYEDADLAMDRAPLKPNKGLRVFDLMLKPFSFLLDVLEKRDRPVGVGAAGRTLATFHKMTDIASMASIAVLVTSCAMSVGEALLPEMFGGDSSPGVGETFDAYWKGLWHDKILSPSDDQGIVNKGLSATWMSLMFATETLQGLNIYSIGCSVMLSLTVLYAAVHAWQLCHQPKRQTYLPITQDAEPAGSDGSSAEGSRTDDRVSSDDEQANRKAGCGRRALVMTEKSMLEGLKIKGHDVVTYAAGATMLLVLGASLYVHFIQMKSNMGHNCPSDSPIGDFHMTQDSVDTTYPGFANCTTAVRGQGSVEASAFSWPMFALLGNNMVVVVRVVGLLAALAYNTYRHCQSPVSSDKATAVSPHPASVVRDTGQGGKEAEEDHHDGDANRANGVGVRA